MMRELLGLGLVAAAACVHVDPRTADVGAARQRSVRPGITVLLDDSIHLIRGRRVGLITNQTGVDEHGTHAIDLLTRDPRATRASVRLTTLFAPEHGIRGTEDRQHIADERDAKTGLPVHSLYTTAAIAPPDSTLRDLDVLLIDLQDVGTRVWTYVGTMLYAMRAAARRGLPVVILDRPNPITGTRVEGPMLEAALASVDEPTPARRGRAYALYPVPLRHGMTLGEMARMFDTELALGGKLHVVPAAGWRRAQWFDRTGLPWVRPSPSLPSLASALLYPALAPVQGTNLSVGRGTAEAFQRVGAPWLRAAAVARLLEERGLAGVRFEPETFTPVEPQDAKYPGRPIPGVRIVVTDRDRVHSARIGAAIVWAIARLHADSLRVDAERFDARFGTPRVREALLRGDDPDAIIDRELAAAVAFAARARKYRLYR